MTLPPEAIERLPYQEAWTPVALRAALEALPALAGRPEGATPAALRDLTRARVAQLAWLGWLKARGVAYRVEALLPEQEGQPMLWAQGRRLWLAVAWLGERAALRRARHDLAAWLAEAVLPVPEAWWHQPNGQPEDVFVFALVRALVTRNPAEVERALARGLPVAPAVTPPVPWQRLPRPMQVVLKYEGPGSLTVRLYGLDDQERPKCLVLTLPAGERRVAPDRWRGVQALVAARPPQGRLGLALYPPGWRRVFPPAAWENLWLYGLGVDLLGYLTRRTFQQQARRMAPTEALPLGERPRQAVYALPATALLPLSDLLARLY